MSKWLCGTELPAGLNINSTLKHRVARKVTLGKKKKNFLKRLFFFSTFQLFIGRIASGRKVLKGVTSSNAFYFSGGHTQHVEDITSFCMMEEAMILFV